MLCTWNFGCGLTSSTTYHGAVQLAGIYLVNATMATLVIIYQLTASNVAGQTERVVSVALFSGSLSASNIVGPQNFQAKDAPQYIAARITGLATQATGALIAIVLCLYYVWAKQRKSAAGPSIEAVAMDLHKEQHLRADQTDTPFSVRSTCASVCSFSPSSATSTARSSQSAFRKTRQSVLDLTSTGTFAGSAGRLVLGPEKRRSPHSLANQVFACGRPQGEVARVQ